MKSVKVRLPHAEAVPPELRGSPYEISALLGPGKTNTKLAKSMGRGYLVYGLSLAPADESGYNLCPMATFCKELCLHHQGRARVWPAIKLARIAKTVLFMEERPLFFNMLRGELHRARRKGEREGLRVAVRPNVLSDVRWEKVAPWLFDEFRDVTYYGYSKLPAVAMAYAQGKLPPNYHITFSRSEGNEADCRRVLRAGGNVAVVFHPSLPPSWGGARVIDGDEHDLRFLDPSPCVVGLTAKGSARRDSSGFVVRPEEKRKGGGRRVALAVV